MDVGKREDRLLDYISMLLKRLEGTERWLEIYAKTNLLDPEAAEFLQEVVRGEVEPFVDAVPELV